MSTHKYYCTRPYTPAAGFGHTGQVEEAVIEAAGASLIKRAETKERVEADRECYDWRFKKSDGATDAVQTDGDKDEI